jgi:hypothetical protein
MIETAAGKGCGTFGGKLRCLGTVESRYPGIKCSECFDFECASNIMNAFHVFMSQKAAQM